MGQLINFFIVLGSLLGIAFILYRKIPLLLELSAERKESVRESMVSRVKSQVQEKIVDTTLSKARNLASKTEMQTTEWLEKLRKKSEQQKEGFHESYWTQLRKKSRKKK